MNDTLDQVAGSPLGVTDEPARNWGSRIGGFTMVVLLVGLVVASQRTGQLDRLGWIAVTIVAVLVGCAALFIGLNSLVSQAAFSWPRYRALTGGIAGVLFGALLRGNWSVTPLIGPTDNMLIRPDGNTVFDDADLLALLASISDPELVRLGTGIVGHVEWAVALGVLGLVGGWLSGVVSARVPRLASCAAVGVAAGWLIGSHLQFRNRPDGSVTTILIWALVGAALGALVGKLTRHVAARTLLGAAVGALVAAWLVPDVLGDGSTTSATIACAVPLGLLGLRLGWPGERTPSELADFDRRARAVVFLGPALGFLLVNLVIPAIRTIYTSLLDRESEEFVGLDNYRELWNDTDSIDASNWRNLFGSQLFWIGLVLLIGGLLIGITISWIRDKEVSFEKTGGSVGALFCGGFVFLTAVFATIRGTFINNLWWVLTVVTMSTILGLAIAVLSERAGRFESAAKAIVFMPMAISMVGASIIWRFQYQARNISKNQTGVLNGLWIELGELSQSGLPRLIVLGILALALAVTLRRIAGRIQSRLSFAGFMTTAIALGWLFIELLRRSLGGFETGASGEIIADTVLFRENAPFNNIFLMVILIWIQTGFAMVILSAAIKAVPGELIEAARIDGADEGQTFFRVTLPQIMPTVGVVVTTLIVTVTKVFDIVKVSTGGNFGTNVLANDFFTESFQFLNRGVGSAIAVLILITVAPVLMFNVWQMQKEA